MRKLVAILVLFVGMVSCKNEDLPTEDTNDLTKTNNELIVGRWKLSDRTDLKGNSKGFKGCMKNTVFFVDTPNTLDYIVWDETNDPASSTGCACVSDDYGIKFTIKGNLLKHDRNLSLPYKSKIEFTGKDIMRITPIFNNGYKDYSKYTDVYKRFPN